MNRDPLDNTHTLLGVRPRTPAPPDLSISCSLIKIVWGSIMIFGGHVPSVCLLSCHLFPRMAEKNEVDAIMCGRLENLNALTLACRRVYWFYGLFTADSLNRGLIRIYEPKSKRVLQVCGSFSIPILKCNPHQVQLNYKTIWPPSLQRVTKRNPEE